jgi:hypothetical protein
MRRDIHVSKLHRRSGGRLFVATCLVAAAIGCDGLEGREAAQEMADIPWTSTDGFFYELPDENRLFIGVMAEGFASTRLYEATASGSRSPSTSPARSRPSALCSDGAGDRP